MGLVSGYNDQEVTIEPIHAPCEIKICEVCGKEYPSRGLKDNGLCTACNYNQKPLSGGPLDGVVIIGE